MRERGLKRHLSRPWVMTITRSLPMRERGLKPNMQGSAGDGFVSLPMRERGLKLIFLSTNIE